MVLELAGFRALYRPVAGVVDARSHLVRDEPSLILKKLDRQDADIVQTRHQARQMILGLRLHLRRPIGRGSRRQAQNALAMMIRDERIESGLSVPTARA